MKVVVAIDDSPHSKSVLSSVCKRHWPADTEFKLLTVMEPFLADGEYQPEEAELILEMEEKRADDRTKQCAAARRRLEESIAGCHVHYDVREGDPKDIIVASAVEWEA